MRLDKYLGKKRHIGIAYMLWFFGGTLGAHKFYLDNFFMGVAYFFTAGFLGIGWLYDLFTLGRQVREYNQFREYEPLLNFENLSYSTEQLYNRRFYQKHFDREKIILQIARSKNGRVTPMDIAVDSPISLDDAKKELDNLVSRGYADLEVTETGMVVYKVLGISSQI